MEYGSRRSEDGILRRPRLLSDASLHHSIRRTRSNDSSADGITNVQVGAISGAGWVPGQEYSHILAYDPIQDILHGHKYATEWNELVFRKIFRFARHFDWFLMTIGVILAILGSLVTPWLYYWAGVALHDILIYETCNATTSIVDGKEVCDIPNFCGLTTATLGQNLMFKILWGWIVYNVSQMGYCICFSIAADRQTQAMRATYFESVVRKDMAWFDLYADKDFAKEMTDQVSNIRLGIGEVIPNFINLVCTVIFMIALVFLLNHKAAIAFLSFIPISIICVYMGNWAERKRAHISGKMFEKPYLVARESFVNIKVIKMYEAERKQTLKFSKLLDDDSEEGRKYKRREVKWMAVAALSSASIWLLLNIATSLVFWYGQGEFRNADVFCDWQKSGGILSVHTFLYLLQKDYLDLGDSPGEILLVYFGLLYITLHAIELPNFLQLIQLAKRNATAVFFIIDWKCRIDNASNEGKMPKRCAVGRLDFRNVSFRYPQKPDETVLNVRQLTIYSGQFVAFAGPENSGKNTILKLIPRLYDCCSGFITLDAVNLQNYNIHWLRRQICVISEAPVIVSGTISENILFGKLDASKEEIEKACMLAEVHHVISNLPNGYSTKISGKDFGDHLSRKEKRQLCLARAYLHRSRVILLDNPILPMDDQLEDLLLRFVDYFRDTATVILASTNVTALSKRADCIYYMENGKIIESGSHIQLIHSKGKYYSRLEGTVNCSTESKNKFESQLKAYKYSQLLQKKRKSSAVVDNSSWEEGAGDESHHESHHHKPRKGLFNSIFKSLSGKHKQSLAGEREIDVEGGGEGSGKMDGKRKSILRQSRSRGQNNVEISHLEEAYRHYNEGRRHSKGDGMHQGFGMMGFQRMNFARPMSNQSTQVKLGKSFASHFPDIGGLSLNILRAKQLTLLRGKVFGGDNGDISQVVERGHSGDAHVRFSILDVPDPNIHDHSKGAKRTKAKKRGQTEKTTISNKIKASSVKHVDLKSKSSPTKHQYGKTDDASNHKMPHITTSSLSHVALPTERDSIQDALKIMTHPASFHLNENVEIDNVSIQTQDLDQFLAEYDEGIYSTLNSEVKGFWRDIFFVVKHDWCYIIPAMISSVVLGLSIPYQIWIVGTFFQILGVEHFYEHAESEAEIIHLGIFMMTTGVVTAFAAFFQEFLFGLAGRRMTRFCREKLFAHILTQDLEWFDAKAHDIGILTFQLYTDTMIVQQTLLMSYGILIQAIFNISTSVAFAVMQTSQETLPLTLCFVAAVPGIIGAVYLSSQKELRHTKNLEQRFKTASNFAQEFLINIKTWFSLGAERFFISQYKTILEKEYKLIKRSGVFISCLRSAVHTSSWLLYGLFIYFTLRDHSHKSHIGDNPGGLYRGQSQYPSPFTKPTLIGFIIIATELLIFGAFRVGDQIAVLNDVDFGKAAAHKIMRILINIPETDPPSKIKTISDDILQEDLYAPPPEIGLTNVSYWYPGMDQSTHQGHLQGVSMTIASSSYVAIVGPPGSGKSALCNIILRMYNPTSGILDFNGDDSFVLSPKVTRRLMGLVEYDPCLFDCSIFENILYGKSQISEGDDDEEADKLEVEEATKLCNCHYDILDMPEDYNTLVEKLDKTAHNFSLKQRISYARALLKKPKILIIDDATTSVDVESDHKILQVLANVRENRTVIVFSHKIEPVRDADTIFVLWEGGIVESGDDSFLLAKKGYYYEMYMTQKVLQESMRNSPQQLNTIRYNIKKANLAPPSPADSKILLAQVAAQQKAAQRKSSIAFVKFLDDKINKMKEEKEERRRQLEKELPKLEMEQKRRELLKEDKRKSPERTRKSVP